MMFKNAAIFRLMQCPPIADVENAVQTRPFVPCAPTQHHSLGFVPARGIANGLYVELIAGAGILRVKTESRSVPPATLKKEVEKRCAAIEAETGRRPGKKQRKEIAEQAELDLMPQAFSKYGEVLVWLDIASKRIVLDTSVASLSDAIVSMLVGSCEGWSIKGPATEMAPATTMTAWLHDGGPDWEEFDLGRDATLKSNDEIKTQVAYTSANLDNDEVKAYIRSGLAAVKLGLVWKGRVGFVLTDRFLLSKVKPLNVAVAPNDLDAFDADVAIVTGELRPLIADLVEAHNGWVEA